MHPSEVVFRGNTPPLSFPVCDHYPGYEKLMRKSIALQQELGQVFDITLDCEDGASTGDEASHARLVASLINSEHNRFGRIGARIHDLTHPCFEQDISLICEGAARRLAYLVVPKVDGLADVRHALDIIDHHARKHGRENLPVHVLIESHGALADAHAIAALPQVECLSFGVMDFVSAHHGAIPGHAMRSPGQFSHPLVRRAKLEIAAACHAHGKVPSHNVTTEIKDLDVVTRDATCAATEFAYTRMWSIHPDQIKPILQAFTPDSADVNDATHILLQAQANQWGPIQYKGTLHDRASYRYYWTMLQRARSSGMPMPDSSGSLF